MRIFDFCCQTKSKKTIDYISSWIDATEIELKQMHTDISKLSASMSSIVTEELGPIFDAYAQTYNYASVIPELSTLQTEIEALSNALENKIDKPLTPASVLKGYIATWGDNKTITASTKKVSDFAPASHTHDVSDITGLNLHTKGICLYEDGQRMIINPAGGDEQTIDEIIGTIKSIIGGAVSGISGIYGDVSNTMFYANIYRNSQSFEGEVPDSQGLIHVWSKRTGTALYDFCIEVYYGDSVYYTTVSDVYVSGGNINYENATFEEEWSNGPSYTVEDSIKFTTACELSLENSQGVVDVLSYGDTAKLWLSLRKHKVYPIKINVTNRGSSSPATVVYGQVVAIGNGSASPKLNVCIANYTINIGECANTTAAQLENGTVQPTDTEWEVFVTDCNNIFS